MLEEDINLAEDYLVCLSWQTVRDKAIILASQPGRCPSLWCPLGATCSNTRTSFNAK